MGFLVFNTVVVGVSWNLVELSNVDHRVFCHHLSLRLSSTDANCSAASALSTTVELHCARLFPSQNDSVVIERGTYSTNETWRLCEDGNDDNITDERGIEQQQQQQRRLNCSVDVATSGECHHINATLQVNIVKRRLSDAEDNSPGSRPS